MPHEIFISHISEEAPIAQVLKKWIVSSFSGQCSVFVSSAPGDILPGNRWLEELRQRMASAVVFLVLCSPKSVDRPWINFETGCAWIKGVRTIPLCHSGQTKDTLLTPLSELQALEIEASGFTKDILCALAAHLGIPMLPSIAHTEMAAELRSALAASQQTPPAPTASLLQTTPLVSDKYVAFCEEYVARVQRGKSELRQYGPWNAEVTASFARDLVAIQQKYALWVKREMSQRLAPFEEALRSMAIEVQLTKYGEVTQERQMILQRVGRTFSQILDEPMANVQERPEIKADQIIAYLRESIQGAEGTAPS